MPGELLRWLELAAAAMEAPAPDFPAQVLAAELARTFEVPAVDLVWSTAEQRDARVVLVGFGADRVAVGSGRLPRPAALLTFVAVPSRPQASADERALLHGLTRLLSALLAQSDDPRLPVLSPVRPVAGGPPLTNRELSVLRLLQEGLTAAGIGHRLAISERTVHKHLETVYRKLGVGDRLSAVAAGQRHRLLPLPAPVPAPVSAPGPAPVPAPRSGLPILV